VCFHRGKLSEGAVFWRCPKRHRLRGESFASKRVEARGVLVRQPPWVVHVGQYPGRFVRPQLWRNRTVLPMRGAMRGESSFTRDKSHVETRRDKQLDLALPLPWPRRASSHQRQRETSAGPSHTLRFAASPSRK
jgi:hypothetical protein